MYTFNLSFGLHCHCYIFRKHPRVEDQPSQHILHASHQMTNTLVKGLLSRNVLAYY